MGNRLLDYNITDYQGRILDNPLTNANFLTQFAQRNPLGYAPPTYGGGNSIGGIARSAATTVLPAYRSGGHSVGGIGSGMSNWATANAEAPRDYLGRAYFDANPGLLGRPITQQAPALQQFQTAANQIGALGRAKDSGNFFVKALQNIGTGVSLASGMSGLVGGLGTLAMGKGIGAAAKAGWGAANGLGKSVVSSFVPRAIPALYNPLVSELPKLNSAVGFAQGFRSRPQSVGGIPRA